MIHSKQHRRCRVQAPGTRGYRRWKTADFSHGACTAPGAPPQGSPPQRCRVVERSRGCPSQWKERPAGFCSATADQATVAPTRQRLAVAVARRRWSPSSITLADSTAPHVSARRSCDARCPGGPAQRRWVPSDVVQCAPEAPPAPPPIGFQVRVVPRAPEVPRIGAGSPPPLHRRGDRATRFCTPTARSDHGNTLAPNRQPPPGQPLSAPASPSCPSSASLPPTAGLCKTTALAKPAEVPVSATFGTGGFIFW